MGSFRLSIEVKAKLDSKVELELLIEAKAELGLSAKQVPWSSKNLDLKNSLTGFIPLTCEAVSC